MHSWYKRFESGNQKWWKQYGYNILLCMSQILSVMTGGDPDETTSSRTGKASRAGKWWFKRVQAPFIDWLLQEKNHCIKAIEEDEGKKQVWDWAKKRK